MTTFGLTAAGPVTRARQMNPNRPNQAVRSDPFMNPFHGNQTSSTREILRIGVSGRQRQPRKHLSRKSFNNNDFRLRPEVQPRKARKHGALGTSHASAPRARRTQLEHVTPEEEAREHVAQKHVRT